MGILATRHRALGRFAAVLAALATAPLAKAAAEPLNQQVFNYLSVDIGAGVAGNAKLADTYNGITIPVTGRPEIGPFGSVATGRHFGNGVGMELEAFAGDNRIKSAYARDTIYGGLLNLTYTTPPLASLYPYIGAGAGYGGITYSQSGMSVSGSGFYWQLKAGVLFPVTSAIVLDLGYRYLATPGIYTGTLDLASATKLSGDLSVVTLGAKLKF